MFKIDEAESSKKFSDFLKIPWIKSSLKIGVILTIVSLVIVLLFKVFNISSTPFFFDVKIFVIQYGLIGIFFVTILAGTILPLGSPAFVVAAALFGMPKIPLILTATIGFTIGMIVNYGLAKRLGRPYVVKKLSREKLEEITDLWLRWGWILYTIFGLIAFLPVELLSFICGLLKTRLDVFIILSFIPRLIVFSILAYFGEQISIWI